MLIMGLLGILVGLGLLIGSLSAAGPFSSLRRPPLLSPLCLAVNLSSLTGHRFLWAAPLASWRSFFRFFCLAPSSES
jgi:hypothetical protein